MRKRLSFLAQGTLLFVGIFLMCCDSVPVVLIGVMFITLSAYMGRALPWQRKKPHAWQH